MEEKRLKVDFLLVFWTFLIIINLCSIVASWYVGDWQNYWFCVIMLLYCTAGAYLSTPKKDQEK